jgi:hypothetical protein
MAGNIAVKDAKDGEDSSSWICSNNAMASRGRS